VERLLLLWAIVVRNLAKGPAMKGFVELKGIAVKHAIVWIDKHEARIFAAEAVAVEPPAHAEITAPGSCAATCAPTSALYRKTSRSETMPTTPLSRTTGRWRTPDDSRSCAASASGSLGPTVTMSSDRMTALIGTGAFRNAVNGRD
jgi:hypothetical protein